MLNKKSLASLAILALVAACSSNTDTTDESYDQVNGAQSLADGVAGPGAAGAAMPGTFDEFAVVAGDRLYYAFDQYNVVPEYQLVVDNQAAWLNQYASINFVIQGHCDMRGTQEYNLALGQRRAEAHKNTLVSRGVDPSRIVTISYGKEKTLVEGTTEADFAQNRATVIAFQ